MRITSLRIRNYRTLESIDLNFPSSYAAICGPNDSGKTNVIRAIRALMKEEGPGPIRDTGQISLEEDFPKWSDVAPDKREIKMELTITLDKVRDAALYEVVKKQLELSTSEDSLEVAVAVTHSSQTQEPVVVVKAGGQSHGGLGAQEVLKKLQSSNAILFHNSTQLDSRAFGRGSIGGYIREIAGQHEALVSTMRKTLDKGLTKISRSQQSEFETLLGRLQTKYKVGLSCPTADFGYMPFRITLGERKFEVPLDDWGSGTKNRTMILLALFRAKQIGESELSASKVTPVIIVEEPESFLHPSAQAELGIVLHDLATEFNVQVIVTTHSPYLLSMQNPSANILLRRRPQYKQLRDTELVDTSGDDWMAPFGHALGLDGEEFEPWKDLVLRGSDAVLLVEGDTDKQYFTMLKDESHGIHRLTVSGEIVAYEGTGSLQNTVLLRFVKNLHRKFFVTFDLDMADKVEKNLKALLLEKGKHYAPIGLDISGKRNIEGLLPESVLTTVHTNHPHLVREATAGSKEEQDSAKNRLKKLYLEEFKRVAKPGNEYFGHFYALTKIVNKALA